MIKPNWNTFKAKFNENPQDNFEWFCYLLFCREFNKHLGIFSYINQSGIETNPIIKDNHVIGWQAKFYDRKLSEKKIDLIKTIATAKRDHPNLTRLIFYTNQAWGQGKRQNDSQAKIDVELKAKELKIEIEWRVGSFFKSPFVAIENENISKHFFCFENNIFDLIRAQQEHSENILDEIQTNILFKGRAIEIDRTKKLEKIKTSTSQVIILSGVGGVGKTALIKSYFKQLKDKTPCYILKATEFELKNINDLFANFNIKDFAEVHKDEDKKVIIIDSAEKLLDLRNREPFKEFLTVLLKNNWKLIFTTRENYLDNLNWEFLEIYRINPLNINIQNLELEELKTIAEQSNFSLPKDEKLIELIKNPFFLKEYLKFYEEGKETNYRDFKEKIWNKVIKKSKPAREQCFLQIAFQRAVKGHFFIEPNCDDQILSDLVNDGILGNETAGYFITHDVYEEWALEKIIKSEFLKKGSNKEFFENIQDSLPIRRSFRSWVSEGLLLAEGSIKQFVEDVIDDQGIKHHWRDEMLVSVLLSDYSEKFFTIFKKELLENNCELLKRLTFLLRTACKEVDEDKFKLIGLRDLNILSLKYVFTKPKGAGWKSIIKFIFDNLDKIGIKNLYFVLPVIYEWNSKFMNGETTKLSSLIALEYYKWRIKEDFHFSRDETKDHLLQTIINGSTEIKDELSEIFEEILKNRWKFHNDPYYELSKFILTKIEGIFISKVLPVYVLRLAALFWTFTAREDDDHYHSSRFDLNNDFNIENDFQEYFPSSAFQTPIYWLLQYSPKETIDFILAFTNKSVEYYAKSELAKHEVEEVEVFIEIGKSIKQYLSNRIWCLYRNTQVAPDVLESIHMALEKYFLEAGENMDATKLEGWLLYLLKNARSASITSVVASIVLRYPEKTFNVALILFKTKEFILCDMGRLVLDQGQKANLLMLKENFGVRDKNEVFSEERLKACDDKHRMSALEHLFWYYQTFKHEKTSMKEIKMRQKELWGILDNYYEHLPDAKIETDSDKTWRLFLARMDRRKMELTTEEKDGQIVIKCNPEIDPDLKAYSETSLKKSSDFLKYSSLKQWASYKLENNEKYTQFDQYETNPKLALKEAKIIIFKLKSSTKPKKLQSPHSEKEKFYFYNSCIPSDVCAVLLKYHWANLSQTEKNFCKDVILEAASSSFKPNYQYQYDDGVGSALSVLPFLLKEFPQDREAIKIIMLLTLFDSTRIGMQRKFLHYSLKTILQNLWEISFDDAQSILFGFLLLKPKYIELGKRVRKENYEKGIYEVHEPQIIDRFLLENEAELKLVIKNKISLKNLTDIESLELSTLRTAFQLIPSKTSNEDHKEIVRKIIQAFSEKILSEGWDAAHGDYSIMHDFLEKLAYFILTSPKEDIHLYLNPFLDNFNSSELIAEMFTEFISAEDRLNAYENFWAVWHLFEDQIFQLSKDGDGRWYIDKIVKSYLFANNPWKETVTEWHTLKEENKRFFKKISEKIGHCPSVLYSISKLLNDVGSTFLDEGITWISIILHNKNLLNAKLEVNTIYYLENIVRKYIYHSREKIRKTKKIKDDVLSILNFLIEKGSVIGYILRESIL